jgi:hypothetical protein
MQAMTIWAIVVWGLPIPPPLSVAFVCCHIFCHKQKGKLYLFSQRHGWNDGLQNK